MPDFDRRDFLKLVGLGAGTAAVAGCADPIEDLVPYVVQPEEITPGIATVYTSTCRECEAACGMWVRTREGRVVKVEGNPDHPVSRGALCSRGHSSLQGLYNPDRYQYLNLQFSDDILIGATSLGLTQHVGVLRGLIQSRIRLGKWKETLKHDPTVIMQAYLANTQAIGHNASIL